MSLALLVLTAVLVILCLGSIWFYTFAVYGAIDCFSHPTSVNPEFHPPITVLKPIRQLNSDAYDTLASFCQQSYPRYQIIFAVQDSTDPSIELVQKLIHQFPECDIELVIDDRAIGANPKVNNLSNAARLAKYDLWLMADADIAVGSDYLSRVVQPFQQSQVGVVTCAYRSQAKSWVAILEALGTATEFHAGVLVARKLEGMSFALGSTIAIRKAVLETIGGFAAIANYLADDFQLGHLPAAAGYQVVLSDYVVEHVLADSPLLESVQRQIRWSRGTRVSRPWGYAGLIFTYGTVTSVFLPLVTGGAAWSWLLLAMVWLIRLTMGGAVGVWGLQDPYARRFWWLMPLRDWISFVIWLGGFVGSTIEWRGERLRLTRGGKLERPQRATSPGTPALRSDGSA